MVRLVGPTLMTITQRPKTPIAAEPDVPQGLSPKAKQGIAIGALAFCLIVGAGIVWWFLLGSSPKRRSVTVNPAQQTPTMLGGGIRYAPQPRNVRGVNRMGDNEWFVRGDSGAMRVSKGSDGSYRFAFTFPNGLNLSREQI